MKKFFFIFCQFTCYAQAMIITKDPLYDGSINNTYIRQMAFIIDTYEQSYAAATDTYNRYANLLILLDHSHTLAEYLHQYDDHKTAKALIKEMLTKHTHNEFERYFPIQEKLENLSTLAKKIQQYTWIFYGEQQSPRQKTIVYEQADYDFVDSIF